MSSTNILMQSTAIQLSDNQVKTFLNGCLANDRTAQKELYTKYFGYVMSIAVRYGINYDDAAAITNNTFLSAFKTVRPFLTETDNTAALFTGWLRAIVINTSVDYIRKCMKSEAHFAVNIEEFTFEDIQESDDPMMQHKDILHCMKRLPIVHKAVFNLYVIEGCSHAEIAGKLNIPEETSVSNLQEARRIIRLLLQRRNLISYDNSPVSITG